VQPAVVSDYVDFCTAPNKNYTPIGYIVGGFDYVDGQCDLFFDGIIKVGKDARYLSSSIATANSQTALILAAVQSSAKAIAIVAAGTELARKLIDSFAEDYTFAPYATEVQRLVNVAKSDYRKNPDVLNVISTVQTFYVSNRPGEAYCLAQNVVRAYARICSISGVEAMARQAIGTAPVKPSGGAGNAPKSTPNAGLESTLPPRATHRLATPGLGLSLPNYEAGSR
jgi:hypothetical protein